MKVGVEWSRGLQVEYGREEFAAKKSKKGLNAVTVRLPWSLHLHLHLQLVLVLHWQSRRHCLWPISFHPDPAFDLALICLRLAEMKLAGSSPAIDDPINFLEVYASACSKSSSCTCYSVASPRYLISIACVHLA